jgi:hypothetical protein
METENRRTKFYRYERAMRTDLKSRMRPKAAGLELPIWGNLRRLRQFTRDNFGFDRGTPIDRYYVDRFFEKHRQFITGDVLEIQKNMYASRFGQNMRKVDSFDIEADPDQPPTFLCDLAHCENVLPSAAYNCVLMPCTLSVLRELASCLRNALRALRPNGVILTSGSALLPLDSESADFWHLTPAGWREFLPSVWPGCEIAVEGHGNCLAVAAAGMGLAVEDLSTRELDHYDPLLPVTTTVFCRKTTTSQG